MRTLGEGSSADQESIHMRSKLLIGGLGAAVAFLLATSPVVAQAAGFITGADIVNETIRSKDVKNGGLLAKDFKAGQLPAGPAGAAGPTGPAGTSGYQRVDGPIVSSPAGAQTLTSVACPAGKVVTGGGVANSSSATTVSVNGSYPSGTTGWAAYVNNGSGSAVSIQVYALCMNAPAARPATASSPELKKAN